MQELQVFNNQDDLFDISILEIDQEKQMVNITRIAKYFNKNVKDWTRNAQTQEYLKDFQETEPDRQILLSIKGGNDEQGTWVHRQVAIKFAAWVNTKFEIWCLRKLDTLFQTGMVSMKSEFHLPQTLPEALRLYADEVEKNDMLVKQIAENKDKVDFFDEVADTTDTFDFITVSGLLKSTNLGRTKFIDLLKEKKILMKDGRPYRKYIDIDYFALVEVSSKQNSKVHIQTRVTQKGLVWLAKILA